MKRYLIVLAIMIYHAGSIYAQGSTISLTRKYSAAMAEKIMREISPNTGKNSDYDLDYESILYDSYAKEIECLVRITWDAKKTLLFSEYQQCMMDGKLYIYLNEADHYGNIKTKFVAKWQNQHTKDCAASHKWNTLTALTFYLAIQ